MHSLLQKHEYDITQYDLEFPKSSIMELLYERAKDPKSTRPSCSSNDKTERSMASTISKTSDPKIKELFNRRPDWRSRKDIGVIKIKNQSALDWQIKNNRRARRGSGDEEEKIASRQNAAMSRSKHKYAIEYIKELNKLFPTTMDPDSKKSILENKYYKKGIIPTGHCTLHKVHNSYHSRSSPSYDQEWSKKMKALYPLALLPRCEKALLKTLKMAPKEITLKYKPKKFNSVTPLTWIHSEYGEFKKSQNGIRKVWSKGLSGHQREGYETIAASSARPIVDQYGNFYESIVFAVTLLGICRSGISRVLSGKNKTAGGLTFRYATPEEIDNYEKTKEKTKGKIK